jgi:serine/threonine-protein kinase
MECWRFHEGEEIAPGRHAVRLLGGGLRYEAYLAWDDRLAALAVAKVVRPHLVEDPRALQGLAGESDALARLAHPMLVRAFDARLHGDRPHLLLELIDGPRLSTLMRRYELNLEQLLPLALNLCSVLHYLAEKRTVHLDVKPRNIVMAGTPKLIDLSIAKRLDEIAALTRPVGTDAYMAPEQCDPARFADLGPPADVWGLGVTLYEAVARRLPFGGSDHSDARFPQLGEAPRPLPQSVPGPLAAVITSCLRKRPADRPTASDLRETLEPIVAALPRPRIGVFRPGGRALMRRLQ